MTGAAEQNFAGRNVVVTGAAGFLGSQLCHSLCRTANCLVRVTRKKPSPLAEATSEVVDIQGDVTDRGLWNRVFDAPVDVVFHLAGQTDLRRSLSNPLDDLEVNVIAPLHLLESARHSGQHITAVFASTATAAGVSDTDPTDETAREHPQSIYDANKLQAEHYLRIFAQEGYVSGAALRLTNVYGASDIRTGANRGVLDQVLDKALQGETLNVFKPGTWLRDYVFIDDVISAFLTAGSPDRSLAGEAYLIGSGVGTPLDEAFQLVAEVVHQKTGRNSPIVYTDPPKALHPVEQRNFIATTDAFTRDTGWTCRWSLEDGLREALRRRIDAGNGASTRETGVAG